MRETLISLLNLTAPHDRIMPACLTLEYIVKLFSRNVQNYIFSLTSLWFAFITVA